MSIRRSRSTLLAALAVGATLASGVVAPLASPTPAAAAPTPDATLTPDPAYTGPAFQGWGTSLAWMANATGNYPAALREDLIEKIFGRDGLRLNIARYNVGGGNASDVADYLRPGGAVPGWWSADPGLTDASGPITTAYADRARLLAAWSGTAASDYDFTADTAQRAWLEAIRGKVTTWEAFSNSPPYFMTKSGYVSGGTDPNADQIDPAAVGKFATYLKNVVQHLEATTGISFDTIDPLNEPNTNYWKTTFGADGKPNGGGQEGAHAGPALQAQVLSALTAELAKPGTTTKARVSGPDETNPGTFVADWNGWTSAAQQTVGQLNVHTYGTGDRIRARDIGKSAGKPLWMSEVEGNWGGNSWNPASIENGLGIAQQITGDLRELEPNAWVLWQPVEDLYNMQNVEKKNWGSVFVDFDCQADGTSVRRVAAGDSTTTCGVQVNSKYNAIRNFTHYIAPGDRIVPTSDTNTTSAIKADGSGAVLVYTNTGTTSRTVKIDLSGFGTIGEGATVTPVTTTESPASDPTGNALVAGQPVVVDRAAKSAVITVPAKSVTTFEVSHVSGVSSAAQGLRDGQRVRLVGVQSGKALTASANATVISSANGPAAAPSQAFTATRVAAGDGTARDRYTLRLDDGRVLTGTAGGMALVAMTPAAAASDPSAQWMLDTTDGSSFSLLNVARQLVLDVGGQSTAEGAGVGLWSANGGANQRFTIAATGGTAVYPDATTDALVAHDFTLYYANSGASSVASVTGAQLGLYQSRLDQPWGLESATGGSWGYVASTTSNPVAGTTTDSANATSTLLVDQEPTGADLSSREVAYAFDVPNGTYDVTFGIDLPAGWTARDEQLRAEGTTLATITAGSSLTEQTFPVTVTDGRLDVSAHSLPGRTNTYQDPALSYVVVKAQTRWTAGLLRTKLSETAVTDRDAYTASSLDAFDRARTVAQDLVDAVSTDATAIKAAYTGLASAFALLAKKIAPYTAFTPGQAWLDDGGSPLQAHGGQVVTSKDADGRTIYYLYGEDRTNGYHSSPGVHVYSSYDLYNWTDRGVALRAMSSPDQFDSDPYFHGLYGDRTADQRAAIYRDLGTVQTDPNVNPAILERPKVIYNEKTHKWVMWMHADGPSATSNAQYAKANAGVAVSDSPYGPFTYLGSTRLDHAASDDPSNKAPNSPGMARDMNLFVDTDGTAYIIYASEENQTMFISKLDADYTELATDPAAAVEGVDYRRLFVGASREAPAMFKYRDRYFLITSGATGWSPNPARYASSTSILGADWTDQGNPFPWWAQSNSWNTQPTSVIPVDPARGKFIFMGDRWNNGDDLANAQLVWLPVNMGEGGTSFGIEVGDRWTLDQLDQWAAWDVTDAPTSLALGQTQPATTAVTVRQNGAETRQAVTWQVAGDTSRVGMVTLTGTLPGFDGGRTVTRTIPIVPEGIRYAVNSGGAQTADWKAIMAVAKARGPVYNATPEQAYGLDAASSRYWGYDSAGSGTYGDASGDIYTTLRYAVSGRDLTYRFGGLQPGTYTVYAGYQDPWPWDARGADVTINGTLVDHDRAYTSADQMATYGDVVVGADGAVTFTLAPTRGHDVQLSWLIVSDPRPFDDSPPTLAVTTTPGSPDASTGWFRGGVRVDATASDASGVASIEYRPANMAEWSLYDGPLDLADGTYDLVFRATDTRGNVSAPQTVHARIDATAPVASIATAAGVAATTVTLTATDAGSGVASILRRIDGGAWEDGRTPFTVTGVGVHTVDYCAVDVAGNAGAMQSAQVAVDDFAKTAPGKPVLSSNVGWDATPRDGDFQIAMDMWWGQNGSLFRLYRDGVLVKEVPLAMSSPAPQHTAIDISGLRNGTYVFTGELIDSKGATQAKALKVRVTAAR